jgi:hypothetical protein
MERRVAARRIVAIVASRKTQKQKCIASKNGNAVPTETIGGGCRIARTKQKDRLAAVFPKP